ncbi:16S rRNA (cytosine(967)-C(5))-methyltransferase RsmB [Noviherbaspirillum aridicola]|uniref:Ribosomal RNA small subunit methyltransferase B n=1 Tax=Noviherbaspirillum aridicola TaxID=2849687 RepID=A0ABQ4Q514_9BURK|nr:16S rRNA (cytosine(967)-C(5))-methyltransferase RsmB [Noviherbaspirillum aridicola]GIZ52194.1 ribosomal RNA small subunit methyltransferase B [Noviherbaspirillum aridicola]
MNKASLPPASLAFSLWGAAQAVTRVAGGTALPQALAAVFARMEPTPQARGAIQDIAYRTMREYGLAQVLLGQLASRKPSAPELHALLCAALALLVPEAEQAPYDPFTVVDQAVDCAASQRTLAPAKGMVNAVLRRFLRERQPLLAQARRQPLAEWNYPAWWIDAMRAAWPQQWRDILTAGNQPPPLTLRVNLAKTGVDDCLAAFAAAGIEAVRVGPQALKLLRALPVAQIPGFAEGLVSVQDAAAQLAAPLLDLRDGMRVLDACAAPGGKTGHMLETARVQMLALDSDPQRLARIDENLRRLQLQAELRHGDAGARDWWDGRPFDRILADVPCTASGIVRRHPDIRWLRRKDDVRQLAALGGRILDNLWPMLAPGGKLLFVTCSIWPQESEQQAAAFAVRHQALRLPAPGQLLPAARADEDHDGLFYALFQKTTV